MLRMFFEKILSLSRQHKANVILIFDFFLGVLISFLYYNFSKLESLFLFNILLVFFIVLFFKILGLYSNRIKFLGYSTYLIIYILFIFILLTLFLINLFISKIYLESFVFLFIYFFSIIFLRISARYLLYDFYEGHSRKSIIIYGAGVSGFKLYESLKSNSEFKVVAFVDDDSSKLKERVNQVKIYNPSQIDYLIQKYNCFGIFIAIPSISPNKQKLILMNLIDKNIVIKILPSIKDFVNSSPNFLKLRDIKIDDLINRNEVKPISSLIDSNILNKRILVTGGGGSIGSEILRQVLMLKPALVVVLDNSEFNLFKLQSEFDSIEFIKFHLGSASDFYFLRDIFSNYKFDTVFHAAAYKHVRIVEENQIYGTYNNILATYYTGILSIENNVQNYVLVSSDKAVKPVNYMGKSKLISEIIIQNFTPSKNTLFSIVRFGNVLNSSGSVLSIFEKQIANGGPLTITDKNATRYFMSIPEAAQLIIQSSAIKSPNRTFVLEMGESYKIYDLAKKIIKINGLQIRNPENNNQGIEIQLTGLKKGEKLHEELSYDIEKLNPTIHPKIYSADENILKINNEELIENLKDSYIKNNYKKFLDLINDIIESNNNINQ